jgi:hypothetical protein
MSKIKSFRQWAEDNKLDLNLTENGKRTGLTANYPPGYVRDQYPHKYFNPIKATADLDLEQKPKTPSDKAP